MYKKSKTVHIIRYEPFRCFLRHMKTQKNCCIISKYYIIVGDERSNLYILQKTHVLHNIQFKKCFAAWRREMYINLTDIQEADCLPPGGQALKSPCGTCSVPL